MSEADCRQLREKFVAAERPSKDTLPSGTQTNIEHAHIKYYGVCMLSQIPVSQEDLLKSAQFGHTADKPIAECD